MSWQRIAPAKCHGEFAGGTFVQTFRRLTEARVSDLAVQPTVINAKLVVAQK